MVDVDTEKPPELTPQLTVVPIVRAANKVEPKPVPIVKVPATLEPKTAPAKPVQIAIPESLRVLNSMELVLDRLERE